MEAKFESLSLFEFQELFPDELSCRKYLSDIKWEDGYKCAKCGNTKYCAGTRPYDRQCTKCAYVESVTAGTVFHKLKFPLLKAFYIAYFVATDKKGITSTELSRKLSLRQKTCWSFKQKIMSIMGHNVEIPFKGRVDVDEFVVGGQEEGVKGRNNKKKKLVVLAIEKGNKKQVKRVRAKVIERSDKKNLKEFIEGHISDEASIKTDAFVTYRALEKEMSNLTTEKSEKKGKNFPEIHRIIMGIKAWLRGVHGRVEYLQRYLDEYCYRFNRHLMKGAIFDNLMKKLVGHPPVLYNTIIC